jgi:hypothetical protein
MRMTSHPGLQDPQASDLAWAVRDLTDALRLVRNTRPDVTADPGYRDVAIIKVQEALWWTEALYAAAYPQGDTR